MDRFGRGGNQRGSFSPASAALPSPARAKAQGSAGRAAGPPAVRRVTRTYRLLIRNASPRSQANFGITFLPGEVIRTGLIPDAAISGSCHGRYDW